MSGTLPEGLTTRGANLADLGSVTALLARCDLAELGEEHTSPEDVLVEWQRPGFDPAADAVLVQTPGGRLVGYGLVYQAHEGDGYVDPAFRRRGIGSYLLGWVGNRALEQLGDADPAGRTLQAWTSHDDTAFRALLERFGYRQERSQWIMRADLASPPPEPAWPAGVALRAFEPERDARAVHALVQEAFGDVAGQPRRSFEHWRGFMIERGDFDPALWFLAEQAGELAGAALCYDYGAEGWVRQLAVRRAARSHGLGLALLRHAFGEFHRRGRPHAGLAVDSDNTAGANRLYERAGMRVLHRFDRYGRPLDGAAAKS